MSRPDTASAAEPRIPRAERTVHRRSAPVPMRVVSHRITPEEAQALASRRASPVPVAVAVPEQQVPEAPRAELACLPAPAGERPLPLLDRRIRRRPFARLMALVRGRRRAGFVGRHRPDTISASAWSMFAPHRRARRRFGARR